MERRRNTKGIMSTLPATACKGGIRQLLPLVLVLVMVLPWAFTALAAETGVTVGDFTVTGGTLGTDYTFDNNTTLVIRTGTPITIANTDPNTPTSHHIDVIKDVSANITLAGVNIDVSATEDVAAFKIADNSAGDVTVTLAEGTTNTLKSGAYCAGLQKSGESGKLTITGTGSLTASGAGSYDKGGSAGIGGGYCGSTSNITIAGGNITASGGYGAAGIGTGKGKNDNKPQANQIAITGGTVNATGGAGGAGIGSGSYGSSNITISGGTVSAKTSETFLSAAIGSGSNGSSNITISGGTVNTTGGQIGIGCAKNGTVTISGGTVNAQGKYKGIGFEAAAGTRTVTISGGIVTAGARESSGKGITGDFRTGQNGNAFIIAKSISDQSGKDSWSGVIIEGNAGQVYGNPTLNTDEAIPEGKTVTVPAGTSLTVGTGTTLTNNGTVKVAKDASLTVEGTLANKGQLLIEGGSLTGDITDNPFTVTMVTEDMIQVPAGLYYDGTDRSEIIKNGTKLKLNDQEITVDGWTLSVSKVDNLRYTVTYTPDDNTKTPASVTVTLEKAQTDLTAEVTDSQETYEYTDFITVTGTVSPAAGSGTVAAYYKFNGYDYQLGEDATPEADGSYTLSVPAKEVGEGTYTITVKFTGNEAMEEASVDAGSVTVNKCNHSVTSGNQCRLCGEFSRAEVEANGTTKLFFKDGENPVDMVEVWQYACSVYDAETGMPVIIRPSNDVVFSGPLTLEHGEKILVENYGQTMSGSVAGALVKVTNGQLTLENTDIVNDGGCGVEVSENGIFILNNGKVAARGTGVLVSGGSFTMNGGTLGKVYGIISDCALEVSGETAAVTISTGDARFGCALEGATAVHLTANAAVTITGGTFTGTTSGLTADMPLTNTKLSGGTFSSVEVTGGTADSLLETGFVYYKDGAKVEDTTVGPVSVAKGSDKSTSDLDLHDVTDDRGNLETDGYSWEYSASGSVLTLKNCTVVGNIILPNKIPVTVRVEGESYVGGSIKIQNRDEYADDCNITFAGSERLYVAGRIGWDSASNNKITISEEANVTAAGGLGITGGSGGILTVNGTLNAVGDAAPAISAGRVILNSGSLNVSGAEGVWLCGMHRDDGGIANAFEMNGGTFSSTCTDYSVRVTGSPSSITGDNAQSAFRFPGANYIPAGFSVQFASDGEYNAVVAIAPNNTPDAVLLSGTGFGGNIVLKQYYTITVDEGITNGTVTVSPIQAAAGDTITLTLTPADGYYGGTPTVTAGSGPVAVTQAEDGTYTFTIESDVTVTASFEKQTDLNKDESISVELAGGTCTYTGQEHKPTVTVMNGDTTLAARTDYTVVYSNNTNAGEATVTVKGKGAYTGTVTKTFRIGKATLTVTGATLAAKTYDGTTDATVETVELSGLVNGETLNPGTDYTATAVYDSADAGNNRTATVTVTLPENSNYTFGGAAEDDYTLTGQTIRPKPIDVTVKLDQESMVYNDSERRPNVKVSYNGTPLDASMYEVTYRNNILPGENSAEVTVTGTKNYAFTVTEYFTITCPHPGMKNGQCKVCHKLIAATVKVGEATTYYTDITSAWNFAQGETATVTMLINQEIIDGLEMASGNITLKMENDAILSKNTSDTLMTVNGGVLTLENCRIEMYKEGGNLYIPGGTVNVTNCTITNNYSSSAIFVAGGTVNIFSGKFTGMHSSGLAAGLYVDSGNAHLYGGTYASSEAYGRSVYDEYGNIGRFLAEGYAFKQNGAWFTFDNEGVIYGEVQVLPIPVSITAQPTSPAAVEYGYTNAPKLTVTAEKPEGVSGEVSYTWHEVGAAEPRLRGPDTDTYTVPMGLTVGTYQYYCEVECDGYTLISDTVTVTVNQRTLTPTIIGDTEKIYDGDNSVAGCSIWLEGVVTGDDVSATATNYIYDSANAGDRTITATGITLSGTAKDNYKLSSNTVTGAGKITKKAPTITFGDQTITYGGTPTNATVDSMGNITYSYEYQGNTVEGWPVNAGTYTVTATAAATDNYLSDSDSITLTIAPKPIQVPKAVTGLIYNGKTQTGVAAGTGYTLYGSTAKNAGDHTATAKVDGNHIWKLADNTLSAADQTISWSIAKKDITVTITANGGTYTGDPIPATAVLSGVVDGENVPVKLTYTDSKGKTSETAPANAGDYTVTASISDTNYNLTGTVSKTFKISKASPALTVPAPENKTYGDADFNLNDTQKGDGKLNFTSSEETVATVDETGKVHIVGTGSTVITVTSAETGNFLPETKTVTVKVQPKPITVTLTPNGGVAGQTVTGATGKLNGLVGDDSVEVTLTYTKEGEEAGSSDVPTKAGIYTVTASINDPNYTLTGNTSAQFVVRQSVTVTVDSLSKTYGDADPALTWSVTAGSELEGTPLKIRLQRAAGENAGTYSITAPDADKDNPLYKITLVEGTLKVDPVDISAAQVVLGPVLIANGQEQTQTVTVTLEGYPDMTYTVEGSSEVKAGGYTMTITGTGNFAGTISQSFAIAPAAGQPADVDEEGNPKIGKGKILVELDIPANGLVRVDSTKLEIVEILTRSGYLSAQTLAQVANGTPMKITILVKETVSDQDKALINEKAGEFQVGCLFDISLSVTLGDGQPVPVAQTDKPLHMTAFVPESLISTDPNVTQTFRIIRCHNGEAMFLTGEYDKEAHTLPITSDRFSGYAIVYQNTTTDVPDSTEPSTEATDPTTPKPDPTSPSTGDTSRVDLWLAMMAMSALGLGIVLSANRKKKTNG